MRKKSKEIETHFQEMKGKPEKMMTLTLKAGYSVSVGVINDNTHTKGEVGVGSKLFKLTIMTRLANAGSG